MRLSALVVAALLSLGLMGTGALGAAGQTAASPGHATAQTSTAQSSSTAQDPRCATNQQDGSESGQGTTSADTGTQQVQSGSADNETGAANENPVDTDNLQCGDQGQSGQSDGSAVTGSAHAHQTAVVSRLHFLRAQVASSAAQPAGNGSESENATETESAASNDQGTDHVDCQQQGQNDGNNTGC